MFAGIISHDPRVPVAERIDRLKCQSIIAPFDVTDPVRTWSDDQHLLLEVQSGDRLSPSPQQAGWPCPDSGLLATFWGRLDNREEIIAQLQLSLANPRSLCDHTLILHGWMKWGVSLPEKLVGDFVLAIVDPKRNQCFLARDPIGTKPLYYHADTEAFSFATTAAAFYALKGYQPKTSLNWLARYLVNISEDKHETALDNVFKLPPGHCVFIGETRQPSIRQWHVWRNAPPLTTRRDFSWVQAYKAELEEAVRCRMTSRHTLGSELSGGLDSSTVTAYLASILGEPEERLHCFSFALGVLEPERILSVSRRYGIRYNHIITDKWQPNDDLVDRSLAVLGYPEGLSLTTEHAPFFQQCALNGIRSLFSGYGGDEAVTSAAMLARYELFDRDLYRHLWDEISGSRILRPLRVAKALVSLRKNPEHNAGFLATFQRHWPLCILRDDVIQEMDIKSKYFDGARWDAPYRRINDFVIQQLTSTRFNARLVNYTLLANSYGVECHWPLLDARLVQRYLSTPSLEKRGPKGMGRYLHRRAVADLLPPKITWHPNKHMGHEGFADKMASTGVIRLASLAQQVDECMHPVLESIVDRNKLRASILMAQSGKCDRVFAFAFLMNVRLLRRANRWLSNGQISI